MIGYLIFIPIGFLLGSVPFGLIAGKMSGVDVREHGSGNTGMANVMRSVNTPTGILVLLLDMTKCVIPVILARTFTDTPTIDVLTAIAAIVGHSYSPFLRFNGGKGTATGWGGLLILSPLSGLVAGIIGVGTILLTRYVSVGSMLSATLGSSCLVVLAIIGAEPLIYALYGIIGTTVIIARHRDNIRRLRSGQERKIGQQTETSARAMTKRFKGLRWPRAV